VELTYDDYDDEEEDDIYPVKESPWWYEER
jgi:hypothetical protein